MKNIAVLGSTGSIGKSTLSVVRNFPGRFKVIALSANSDVHSLCRQIEEFQPSFVCIRDKSAAARASKIIKRTTKIFVGDDGLDQLVRERSIEQVMFAISGSGALSSLVEAIKGGKSIALANKETLVMAGPLIMGLAKKKKVSILPVDSEQSAIWQCLEGENRNNLRNIYLTASGGPLLKKSRAALESIRVKQVLRHPRWKMGKKITVDSATLMNKGLELLEAMFLFDVDFLRIKVLVHPEALIHSMVEFIDGVIIAQLSVTDMRIPIQYALSYPERLPSRLKGLDFYKLGVLNFEKPDLLKFPCLGLAYEAAKGLGTLPCVLNAANEVAVGEFLRERLRFTQISKVVEKVMRNHSNKQNPGLRDIQEADNWARISAQSVIARLS
ncbi:MAG: 1-deoxy-D-xylulose-5-phosphate reductoisomerase [Candidatus Omnitrophica bacterium]|nr:1-deoxy-D-xylulose-5-phosphate reductoisomerase [Candidatus Omnitrophota bacterium]